MKFRGQYFERALGACVLLGIIGSSTFFYLRSRHLNGKYIVMHAEFDAVDGLRPGAPVKISGVTVGTVLKFKLDPESSAVKVTFNILKKMELPEDTSAFITGESLFGEKILKLDLGNAEEKMPQGGTIYQTQAPLMIEDLIYKFLIPDDKKGKNRDTNDKNDTDKNDNDKNDHEKEHETS